MRVSIHARLISRAMLLTEAEAEDDDGVSIHARLISRAMRIQRQRRLVEQGFQSTPG